MALLASKSLNLDINAPLNWIELDCVAFGSPVAPSKASVSDADKILTKRLELQYEIK